MDLVVDTRERALVAELQRHGVPHTVEPLAVGDAVVRDAGGAPMLVVERKTLADLASSIRDGRYEEQSLRLQALAIPNSHVLYIIEGSARTYTARYNKIALPALRSAMCSLNYYKGFSVARTQSVEATADLVAAYLKKIARRSAEGAIAHARLAGNGVAATSTQAHIDALGKRPSAHITPEAMPQLMLSQIPGVSSHMACALLQNATFGELLRDPAVCLSGATYTTAKGATRRIPCDVVQAVCAYTAKLV